MDAETDLLYCVEDLLSLAVEERDFLNVSDGTRHASPPTSARYDFADYHRAPRGAMIVVDDSLSFAKGGPFDFNA